MNFSQGLCRVHGLKFGTVLGGVLLLSACSTVKIEQLVDQTNQQTQTFTQGNLKLIDGEDQRRQNQQQIDEFLRQPLNQNDAVQLALLNNPAWQAMLAQHAEQAAQAAQSGRIANPVFTFERIRFADELELGRLLSFGLLDLLTWPQRYSVAQQRISEQQLRLSADVVERVTQVRQVWVKAVAAQQSLQYAEQVKSAAQASAELARRMQAAGNFSPLQSAQQQAFYADALLQFTLAQHTHTAQREQLIHALGLNAEQASALQLPDTLPELPQQVRSLEELAHMAGQNRLDIQMARLALKNQAQSQNIELLNSWLDVELGVRRDTVFDNAASTSTPKRGYEIDLRIPLFDWGDQQRAAVQARGLAAAHQLEATLRSATSQLRESYSAYQSAFTLSEHYRQQVLPLQKTMSEQNLLRYNGMLIGVFELLADARQQINTSKAAISAQQQFWLAEAALQAALIGQPSAVTLGLMNNSAAKAEAAPH